MMNVFPFLEPRRGGFTLDFLALSKMFATFAVPNKITPKYESLTAA